MNADQYDVDADGTIWDQDGNYVGSTTPNTSGGSGSTGGFGSALGSIFNAATQAYTTTVQSRNKPKTTPTAKSPTWLPLAIGGAVLLVVVMFILGRK